MCATNARHTLTTIFTHYVSIDVSHRTGLKWFALNGRNIDIAHWQLFDSFNVTLLLFNASLICLQTLSIVEARILAIIFCEYGRNNVSCNLSVVKYKFLSGSNISMLQKVKGYITFSILHLSRPISYGYSDIKYFFLSFCFEEGVTLRNILQHFIYKLAWKLTFTSPFQDDNQMTWCLHLKSVFLL